MYESGKTKVLNTLIQSLVTRYQDVNDGLLKATVIADLKHWPIAEEYIEESDGVHIYITNFNNVFF